MTPDYEAAFDALCRASEASGGVSAQMVAEAEQRLAVRFPAPYRKFLEEFGAVLGDGFEIFGLPGPSPDGVPLWQDIVATHQQLKSWNQFGTERQGFLPVSEDGTGVYFFMDMRRPDASPIHALGPGVDTIAGMSFHQFFVDYARGEIQV